MAPVAMVASRALARMFSGKLRGGAAESKKPLGGFFWWFILGFSLLKDFFDILLALIGMVFFVTGVGAVLSLFLTIIAGIITFFLATVQTIYFIANGVSPLSTVGKMSIKLLTEIIPFVNLFPWSTVLFITHTWSENRRRRAAQKRATEDASRQMALEAETAVFATI